MCELSVRGRRTDLPPPGRRMARGDERLLRVNPTESTDTLCGGNGEKTKIKLTVSTAGDAHRLRVDICRRRRDMAVIRAEHAPYFFPSVQGVCVGFAASRSRSVVRTLDDHVTRHRYTGFASNVRFSIPNFSRNNDLDFVWAAGRSATTQRRFFGRTDFAVTLPPPTVFHDPFAVRCRSDFSSGRSSTKGANAVWLKPRNQVPIVFSWYRDFPVCPRTIQPPTLVFVTATPCFPAVLRTLKSLNTNICILLSNQYSETKSIYILFISFCYL